MTRYLLAIPLIMHGLAHLAGFAQAWSPSPPELATRPWLLSSGITLGCAVGKAYSALWLVAACGLVAAGLGIILLQGWWPVAAIVGSSISLLVIIPWWNTVIPGAKAGAAFDILIAVALVIPAVKERILALVT